MPVRNIVVFIEGGTKTLKLTHPFLTQGGSTIALRQASVFWKFKNVTDANNGFAFGTGVVGGDPQEKTLQEGYWDFHLLKERLEGEHVTLTPNVFDNTCKIKVEPTATGELRLKKFGKLLGFPENHTIAKDGEETSPNPVDVNCGLRYLEITCDLVDSSHGIGTDGDGSSILACLPITPGTRLNSSVSQYVGNYPALRSESSIVTEIVFTVKPNIDIAVDADVLLNVVIESME